MGKGSLRGRRKWCLYVHRGPPQLKTRGRLLRHVLDEPKLTLSTNLFLLTLMLLIQSSPPLLVHLLLLLPRPLQTFLHVLSLLHLLQLPNLLHLLQHLGVESDPLCYLLLRVSVAS